MSRNRNEWSSSASVRKCIFKNQKSHGMLLSDKCRINPFYKVNEKPNPNSIRNNLSLKSPIPVVCMVSTLLSLSLTIMAAFDRTIL